MKKITCLFLLISITAYSFSQTKKAIGYAEKGRQAFLQERYLETIRFYDTALSIDPTLSLAFVHRGLAKSKAKQYADAIMDYNTQSDCTRRRKECGYGCNL
jgi:tetratricopeptide (TPR) repeat protein